MLPSYFSFLRSEARWLAFGSILCFTSSLGQTFFVSLFSQEIRDEIGLGHAAFAGYYSIGTILGALVLFWIGRAVDSQKLHLTTGATLLGLGLAGITLAMTHSAAMLILAFFMLRLCGQGMASHIAITCMARWYARNRGKAISIASLGQPLGEALLPPMVVLLLGFMSWRDAWWLFTAILAVVLVPLLLGLVWKGERIPKTAFEDQDEDDTRSWRRNEVLRDPRFWLMLPAVTGPAWIFTGVFFHQVSIVGAKGWEFADFAMAYLAFATSKVITGLYVGILIDRLSARLLAPWAMPLMSLALAVLVCIDQAFGAWVFMVFVGVHMGLHQTTMGALWPELYGRRHLGSIKAMSMAIGVLVSALGPPIFGVVLDRGFGVDMILWFCVAYGLVAAAMMFVAARKSD